MTCARALVLATAALAIIAGLAACGSSVPTAPTPATQASSAVNIPTPTPTPATTPASCSGAAPQVAQITSPAPGSTLPAGAVTFTWCNANSDYFLTIESLLGARNIFNAFVVGQESITLGPACNVPSATSPTTGCIPQNGETIFVTLWTNIAQSGRKNYVAAQMLTYTAAK